MIVPLVKQFIAPGWIYPVLITPENGLTRATLRAPN